MSKTSEAYFSAAYPMSYDDEFDSVYADFVKNNFTVSAATQTKATELLGEVFSAKSATKVMNASAELSILMDHVRELHDKRREQNRVQWTPEEENQMRAMLAEGRDKNEVMREVYQKRSAVTPA